MKVAIVHDYIKEYGGAERVLETLHEVYPDATIYTSVYCPSYLGPHRQRFEKMHIKTSFLQYIPFKEKLLSPFRLISPLIFKLFDLSSYDVILISQTGAYFPNFVRKGKATLITYTHTPPRYLYGYKTAREWKKNKIFFVLAEIANHFLRLADFSAAQNVDQFICNSEEVRKRIQKWYRKDAIVIYPPVDIASIKQLKNKKKSNSESYYLAGGRLARAKGMDVIIDAFNHNKKPLKVFGKGFAGYGEELRKKAKKNIEFVGEVTDEEKLQLMVDAKAFIFASYDEDFGITPVEVMGTGTPVIAYRSGGVQETVVEGKTGVFYAPNTPSELVEAVEKFEKAKIKKEDCIKQAQKFSKERFVKEIKRVITS